MTHTPLMITPGHGWVPDDGVVTVVVGAIVVDVVVVVGAIVVDVVVDVVVVDVVVVAGRVVVVVAGRVVVVVVEVEVVADVVGEPGGVVPPRVDGTHNVRSGVNRRERFARLTSKQTQAGPEVTTAGATAPVPATGAGTHRRLGSSTRSRSRSPIFTGNGGVKATVAFGG